MTKQGELTQAAILSLLRQSGVPMSAYDVLDALRAERPKIAPPTVYRALSALTEKGAVHKLESIRAYVACQCDSHEAESILSICDDCGLVEECVDPDLVSDLARIIRKTGFAPAHHMIEVHGTCASCNADPVLK